MKKITFLIALFVGGISFAQQSVVEDFESSPTVSGFEGLADAVIEAAPTGSNGSSFKLVTDPSNGQPWQGAQVDLASGILVDLSTDKTMSIDVYSTTAFGLMVKVEDKVNNTAPNAANTQSHTGSGWETLTFSFTTGSDGTTTANGDYSRVVFFPNRKADDSGWADPKVDVTIYVDNITAVKKEVTVNPDPEPSQAAPTPPARDAADVISIFSDAYDDVTIQTLPEGWSQHGNFDANFDVAGNATWKIGPANEFLGMTISDSGLDVSGMDKIHIDYWTEDDVQIGMKLVSGAGEDPLINFPATVTGSWQSVDLDLSDFQDMDFVADRLIQLLIDPASANLMYVDNVYFYKESDSGPSGELLTDGDFEAQSVGAVSGAWYGAGEIRNDGGGNYYFADVQAAGNPYDVNLSQKGLSLTEGTYYKLTFTASSNVSRTAVIGIGLSADPWTAQTETVDLTTDSQTFELTLQANFTSTDARVIFDLGAAVGHVVLDDVSLVETTPSTGELLTDGDFEAQSVGAVSGAWYGAGEIKNDGGGNYYFADVQAAGNPYDVNLSQKGLSLTEGTYYKLTFTASSNVSRTAVIGIGLSADPWTAQTETVDLTTDSQTFELTLQANFTSTDARVIFDLGAAVGHFVLDNVSLVETTAPAAGPTTTAPDVTFGTASDYSTILSGSNLATGLVTSAYGGATEATVQIDGKDVKKLDIAAPGGGMNFAFAGQDLEAAGHTHLLFYYYTEAAGAGKVINVNIQGAGANIIHTITLPVSKNSNITWTKVDVELASLTNGSDPKTSINQVQFTGAGGTDPFGTVYIDNMYFYKSGTAGVGTNELFNVSVFPNPASNTVKLRADETITRAEVYNILGKKVRSFNVNATSTSFNISDLNAGIYLLKYEINNKVGTTRFVKQ